MKTTAVIPLLAATAACALAVVPAAAASAATTRTDNVPQASSANWSGYVVGGSSSQKFKSVSGSWVVPKVNCSSGSGYSAQWIGLGGAGQQQALEQDGTEADCSTGGTASYFAWYELVPAAPVKLDLAVHPGDKMSSTVTVNGHNVTMHLIDDTTGQSVTKSLTASVTDVSSAEWITEAPSTCDAQATGCTPLPLADFGTVSFSGASATTTGGHTGTISDPAWSAAAVTLNPSAGTQGFGGFGGQFASASADGSAGATPSSLSSDGSAFSVTWSPAAGGGATETSGSAGDGYGAGGGYGSSGGDGYGAGGGYPGDGSGGYAYVVPTPGGGYAIVVPY